jgi:hypothetical protein
MRTHTEGAPDGCWLRAVAFCLVGAALAVCADRLLWSGLRRARGNNFAVWNALVAGRLGSDLLITGGSRALVGIDCERLASRLSMSCFNIGLDGSPANLQRPYLETYLLHNKAPRLAVISLDMGSLTESRTPYDLAQYLPYLAERPIAEGLSRYVDVWKYRYLPLYAFSQLGLNQTIIAMGGVIGRYDSAPDRLALHGFRPMDTPWDDAFDAFAAENPNGAVFPIDEAGVGDCERMVSMLESRGARVVFVFSPEWEGVRRLEVNRDELMRRYTAIATKHHTIFIDYSDSAAARNKSLFYNSQHLNRRGANIFTAMLASDLADLRR